jgi:hypothetical protein
MVNCATPVRQLMPPFFEIVRAADGGLAQHAGNIIDICCGAAREDYNRVIT